VADRLIHEKPIKVLIVQ